MYRPPPLRRSALADKKVLLIDRSQATRDARAAVLRSHGVEVHEAEEISAARFLWQPNVYDLVMLGTCRVDFAKLAAEYFGVEKQLPPKDL
jgi:DNA-binding NtrC family response regulator